MENDFAVDTRKQVKKDFLKKVGAPLGIALFLIGFEICAKTLFLIDGFSTFVWNETGVYEFAVKCLNYLSMVCIFASMIKTIFDAKPFSHTLTICIRIISVLYLIGSIGFPRLSGYETNYAIGWFNGVTLIDANLLICALLLYVFSIIICEGFSMQKDIEETL